jgi:hypothetical protein
MTKTEYNQALRNGICTVVFQKKDGSERTMHCTLQQDIIENNNLSPVGGGSVVPDTQVRCIDTDIMQWRSFNVESVITFK